jgi:hypothetical protein
MLPRATLWIKVRPEGRGSNSNRSAIGARVLVRYAGKVQAQWVTSQSGFLSANDPRLQFGLGTAAKVSVEVHWPLAHRKLARSTSRSACHHPQRPGNRQKAALPVDRA